MPAVREGAAVLRRVGGTGLQSLRGWAGSGPWGFPQTPGTLSDSSGHTNWALVLQPDKLGLPLENKFYQEGSDQKTHVLFLC